MSSLEFDAPDEIPPPAYEFSQEEFDQKISHALDASQTATDEPDEWETWDEAAFAAAAAQLTLSDPTDRASSSRSPPAQTHFSSALASSSSATNYNNGSNAYSSGQGSSDAGLKTQPLRVVKKSRPSSAGREKERPSWYAEAQLDTVNTPPAPAPRPQRQPSPPRSSLSHSISVISRSGNGEREPTPPPMFEPIGPSLDGPPYEGFDGQNPATQGLVMTYVPGDSRPASPLHSPTSPSLAPAYPQAPPLVQPSAERRSLPRPLPHAAPSVSPPVSPPPRQPYQSASPPPRQTYQSVPQPRVPVPRVSPRPVTSYNARPKSYAPPRIAFDPRVAYGGADSKGSSYFANREELPPPTNIDPASFYTSAVSSIYTASTRRQSASAAPPPPSSFYGSQPSTQSSYSLSQSHLPAQGLRVGASYPNRDQAHSPAPSEMTVASSGYQDPYQSYQQTPSAPSTYQPTSYQPSSYQPTSYQPTSYQTTSHQQNNSYQPQSAYQPTTYQQQTNYQPTSYPSNGYSPTTY